MTTDQTDDPKTLHKKWTANESTQIHRATKDRTATDLHRAAMQRTTKTIVFTEPEGTDQ